MPLATSLPWLSTARSFQGCFSIIPSEKGSSCLANEFPREYVRIGSLLALVLPNATKSFLPLMESKLICLIKIISVVVVVVVVVLALMTQLCFLGY